MAAPTKTVMVIDDDPSAIRLIEKALEHEARIRQEYGAPERGALDLEDVDLVVLDYKMPGRDGLDVLSEIRELYPSVPVLFMTGFGDPEIAERALREGADRFVTKPVSPGLLQGVFREIVHDGGPSMRRNPDAVRPPFGHKEEESAKARMFWAIAEDGSRIGGKVVRFSPQSAIVEFENAEELRFGARLQEIRFRFGRQNVEVAEAVVGSRVEMASGRFEAEILIHRPWNIHEGDGGFGGGNRCAHGLGEAEPAVMEGRELPDSFRLATHEFAGLLKQVQEEASAFEFANLGTTGGLEQLKRETAFATGTARRYHDAFWTLMRRFEAAAEEVEEAKLTKLAKPFARKLLYPYMLCSPFISRVVERPLGVPGDFDMLGQILGNPLEGHSLYDRIVSSYILESGAANAYRYRVKLLLREIRRCVENCRAEGRRAKILSMASGVAYEVQQYVQDPLDDEGVDFTLVDFSEDTLEEARRQYAKLGKLPDNITLNMQQSSVIDLANRSRGLLEEDDGRFVPDSDYDHVYCAGLFDYLSDRLIVRVIAYLHGILRPGGTLVVSNYTRDNPIKGYMTIVMDWELIYRTREEFTALVKRAVPGASFEIELDDDGAEVYAIAVS
ncbi:MAG: response regulator [Verrucomicrobiales bacterium]